MSEAKLNIMVSILQLNFKFQTKFLKHDFAFANMSGNGTVAGRWEPDGQSLLEALRSQPQGPPLLHL